MRYVVEKTDRDVKPMEFGAVPTEKVKVVWDKEEAVGLELPYGDIVASESQLSADSLPHTISVARGIENYVREHNISEIWIG